MTYPGAGGGGIPGIPSGEVFNGGFADYNDATTAITPIAVTGGAGFVKLTNDGAGAFANKAYLPASVTDVWDTINDQFDWSQLALGDMVDIRLDVEVTTTSPNQFVEIDLFLAVGAGEYAIPFIRSSFKNSGVQSINRFNGIYMGDAGTQANPGEFRIQSDGDCTVVVNGWYCKIIKRG